MYDSVKDNVCLWLREYHPGPAYLKLNQNINSKLANGETKMTEIHLKVIFRIIKLFYKDLF